jgi:DNA-binding CsgD family transcriptional regulator
LFVTNVERVPTLAGLVSTDAEEIYLRLRVAGTLRAGTAAGEVDPHTPGVVELLDLGIAFRTGPDERLIRPVDPAAALRMAIAARQHDMISFHNRILDGWARLSHLLPSAVDGGGGGSGGNVPGIRVLTRMADIVTRTAELCAAPENRLRATENGVFPPRQTNSPPAPGARRQVLYEADYQRSVAGTAAIERATGSGDEVRLRHRLPLRMLHVDDAVALVATEHGAVLVQVPAVVSMLGEWFDLLWDHPATTAYPAGGPTSCLNPVQRNVLTLMLACDDETIARRLELSVTTVRRHIKAIYRALGVNSRFAAGMAAAKQNWL